MLASSFDNLAGSSSLVSTTASPVAAFTACDATTVHSPGSAPAEDVPTAGAFATAAVFGACTAIAAFTAAETVALPVCCEGDGCERPC